MSSKVIIFKNDRVGDLISSVSAINLILKNNKDKKIIIYLSEINYKMRFLFNENNVETDLINYKLPLKHRLYILYYFLKTNISKAYILRPKNFFFLLPLIFYFKGIKFYGLCINSKNNYKRPNNFLRKFLEKSVINDRETFKKRTSREEIQLNLVNENSKINNEKKDYNFKLSNLLKKVLPNDFCLIHYKKQIN